MFCFGWTLGCTDGTIAPMNRHFFHLFIGLATMLAPSTACLAVWTGSSSYSNCPQQYVSGAGQENFNTQADCEAKCAQFRACCACAVCTCTESGGGGDSSASGGSVEQITSEALAKGIVNGNSMELGTGLMGLGAMAILNSASSPPTQAQIEQQRIEAQRREEKRQLALAAQQLIKSGLCCLKQQDYACAINECQQALGKTPDDPEIIDNLALAKHRLEFEKEKGDALGDLKGGTPSDGDSPTGGLGLKGAGPQDNSGDSVLKDTADDAPRPPRPAASGAVDWDATVPLMGGDPTRAPGGPLLPPGSDPADLAEFDYSDQLRYFATLSPKQKDIFIAGAQAEKKKGDEIVDNFRQKVMAIDDHREGESQASSVGDAVAEMIPGVNAAANFGKASAGAGLDPEGAESTQEGARYALGKVGDAIEDFPVLGGAVQGARLVALGEDPHLGPGQKQAKLAQIASENYLSAAQIMAEGTEASSSILAPLATGLP